ncbi:hypothetical protein FRC07_007285 [Ceratobasidium sp. 392]|nr:hypothetical protein FRC07_007285 [Ceratobasidium sp. 392]
MSRRSTRLAARPAAASQMQQQDLDDLLGPPSDDRNSTASDDIQDPPPVGDISDENESEATPVPDTDDDAMVAVVDDWSGAIRTVPKGQLRVPTMPTMFPGVFQDSTLLVLNITLFIKAGIWYCETCRQNPTLKDRVIGLGTQHIENHIRDVHRMSIRAPGVKEALDVLGDYAAWDGKSPAPVPRTTVAPYPFLERKTIKSTLKGTTPQACGECNGRYPFIWINNATRWSHLKNKYGLDVEQARLGRQYPVVQSFSSMPTNLRYFPVNEALAALPQEPENSEQAQTEAIANYITQVDLTRVEPITRMGPPQGQQGEIPFIDAQGWSTEFKGKDPKDLSGLTEVPAKKNSWYNILHACASLYGQWQRTITQANLSFRRQLVDTGNGPPNKFVTQMNKLQSKQAIQSYARHLCRLILLILRTRKRRKSKSKAYTPYLTPDQEACADELLKKLDKKETVKSLSQSIHKLSVTCFAPEDPSLTATTQYHDITHMYIALAALNPDGSYRSPSEMVRSTTAMQYAMRAALLQESTNQAGPKFGGNVNASFKHYRSYLMDSDDQATPFCTLQLLRRLLADTVASTAGYGNLHWAGENKSHCSYKGHTFELSKVQSMAQATLDRAEKLMDTKVLKDISLDAIGYQDPDYLSLQDHKDERANHYSVWQDPDNVELHVMRDKLLAAFTTHPSLKDFFFSEVRPDGSLDWKNKRRMEWLQDVQEFLDLLAVSTHFHGGQSRRATEFCGMKIRNVAARLRDVFLHGADLLFIIGYSKTGAITLRDRMDVHLLPPRLTRLFFIFNTIVRPLAVQWTKELLDPAYLAANEAESEQHHTEFPSPPAESQEVIADPKAGNQDNNDTDDNVVLDDDTIDYDEDMEDELELELDMAELEPDDEEALKQPQQPSMLPSTLQATYAFACLGSVLLPSRFSDLIAKVSLEFLGVELKAQAWRHVSTAIQRDILDLSDPTTRALDTVFDAQRAHSNKVSGIWYAVNSNDRRLVGAGSIEKYMIASRIWQDWLSGKPPRTPTTVAEELMAKVTHLESEVSELKSEVSAMKSEVQLARAQLTRALEILERLGK